MPNNNKMIKLHKGTDNTLNFRVRNMDLKLVDLAGMAIKAKVVDRINNEKVLEKYLEESTNKGYALLKLLEGDLVDIAPGFYELVIMHEDSTMTQNVDYYAQQAFYVDQADNVSFDVEVTAQGDSLPLPTTELLYANYLPILNPQNQLCYYTDAVPCNAMRNHRNSIHTFAIYGEEFYGTVKLYGSLDLVAPVTIDQYFPIELAPGVTTLEYENFNGVDPYSFSANLVWVKFVITPEVEAYVEKGKIPKILWRS